MMEQNDQEEKEERRKLMLFGRDVSQVPCFRESFLCGLPSGIGIGIATFIKTSRPQLSTHVGFTGFVTVTLGYWFVCRYQWSKAKFQVAQMKEALQAKVLYEGTPVEEKLEREGILKKV